VAPHYFELLALRSVAETEEDEPLEFIGDNSTSPASKNRRRRRSDSGRAAVHDFEGSDDEEEEDEEEEEEREEEEREGVEGVIGGSVGVRRRHSLSMSAEDLGTARHGGRKRSRTRSLRSRAFNQGYYTKFFVEESCLGRGAFGRCGYLTWDVEYLKLTYVF
jgi:hypothetical protein